MRPIKIPRENANDDFVHVVEVCVANGEWVEKGHKLIVFETSKATVEFESPDSGTIAGLKISKDSHVGVDEVFCYLAENADVEIAENEDVEESVNVGLSSNRHLSIAAKELIRAGKHPKRGATWLSTSSFHQAVAATSDAPRTPEKIDIWSDVEYDVATVATRKRYEIAALRQNSPYLNSTLGIEIVSGERQVKSFVFDEKILDFVLYETALLLEKDFADLNRFYISDHEVGMFKEVIPGFALDNGANLAVMRVPPFDTLAAMQQSLIEAIGRYEDNKATASDLRAATFTVSDLSATLLDFMLPLINGRQAFILGICKASVGFRVFGTFDHRVTEGKRFADFLTELKRRVELHFSSRESGSLGCYFCDKTLAEERRLGFRGMLWINDGVAQRLICNSCYEGW